MGLFRPPRDVPPRRIMQHYPAPSKHTKFFDHFTQEWVEGPSVPTTHPRSVMPRQTLLNGLVEEIQRGDSECKLYAALLARKLIGNNHHLMAEFGRRIAALTTPRLA